jgi:YbbR domain-containing protein
MTGQNRILLLLTRHWELKILAVVFSAGLWVFVMTSEKTNVLVSLPLDLDSVPAGLVVTGEKPESVEVQLHGLRAALAQVSPESLRVRVSLAGARVGDLVLSLGPDQIVVPPGVTVLRVNPAVVRVALARAR